MPKQDLVVVDEGQQGFVVKDIGSHYPESSVLAGQVRIKFIDAFDTLEQALSVYPGATPTHKLLMPTNSVAHLPDEEDY